jgi:hypothetical protein
MSCRLKSTAQRARRCRAGSRECKGRRPPPVTGARYPHGRPDCQARSRDDRVRFRTVARPFDDEAGLPASRGPPSGLGTTFAPLAAAIRIERCNLVTEGSVRPLDQMSHDMRFALRQFRRAPGLTLAACLRWPAGLAWVTTVFTLVDAVVCGRYRSRLRTNWSGCGIRPSPPDVRADPRSGHMLRGVFAWEPRMLRGVGGEPDRRRAARDGRVSRHAGPQPAAGRLLIRATWGIRRPRRRPWRC